MEFKYSLSLLFSNMGFVLKILLWVVISALIVAAIGAAVLIPTINSLAVGGEVGDAYAVIASDISSLVDGQADIATFVRSIITDGKALIDAVLDSQGLLTALIFEAIGLYVLYVFLVGICIYPTAYAANQLMSSNMRIGLAASIAMHLKKAVRYSACNLTVSVPLNAVIVALICLIAFGLWDLIGFFALTLALAFGVFAFSAKSTLLGGWLPRLLFNPDEPVYTAFVRSLRGVKLNMKGLIKSFVITYFVTYLLVVTCALPTFGLVVLVVPSFNYFLLRLVELVGYYKMNGLSFYTDAITVVDTVEFGYRAENQADAGEIVGGKDYLSEVIPSSGEERTQAREDAPEDKGEEDAK